jgi:hypothetical protein
MRYTEKYLLTILEDLQKLMRDKGLLKDNETLKLSFLNNFVRVEVRESGKVLFTNTFNEKIVVAYRIVGYIEGLLNLNIFM